MMFKKFCYGLLVITSLMASEAIDEEIIKDLEFFEDMEIVEDEFIDVSEGADKQLVSTVLENES